jgi:uncharacterized protein with HEPN domain
MLDAGETVASFLVGRTRRDLDDDRMLLFAVLRAIEVLGEAANRVSEATRAAHPEIPWASAVAMRNRLIHGYFDVDGNVVWTTATQELPGLVDRLRAMLREA